MNKQKISGTSISSEHVGSEAAGNGISELSLLEQIRAKEEEQNGRIEAARQQYINDIEYARREADSWLAQERSLVQTEADSVWQEAMDRINRDVERILSEGEQQVCLDRELKEKRFDGVVNRVIREISKG